MYQHYKRNHRSTCFAYYFRFSNQTQMQSSFSSIWLNVSDPRPCEDKTTIKTHELIVSNGYGYMFKLPHETQQSLVYLSAPVNPNLVILDSSVIVLESSYLLKKSLPKLWDISSTCCFMDMSAKGLRSIKRYCCRALLAIKSKWTGQRTKPSNRTGCTACVTMFPLSSIQNMSVANQIKGQFQGS